MIYYEFDRTGNGGKYKEMTEAGYEMAAQDPNRFFLEGWDEPHKKLLYMIEYDREVFDQVQGISFFRSRNLADENYNRLPKKQGNAFHSRRTLPLCFCYDYIHYSTEISIIPPTVSGADEKNAV